MKLLYDVNQNRWYNENGKLFSGYRPSIPYGNTERVEIQLYSDSSQAMAVTEWTKYTELAGENYGAVLSADNNFLHWFKSSLLGDLAAGSVASISVATNESLDNIAEQGDIYLYRDGNSTPEALEYASRAKTDGGIVFTLAPGSAVENPYSSGAQVDIPEMLYAETLMIDEESDPRQGLFVFEIVMDSPKLRNAMQYKSVERLADVKGLELMIYQVGTDDTLKILKRFRCGSFSIEGGIADLRTGVPVPQTRQSEILALIRALLRQTDYPTTDDVRGIVDQAITEGDYVNRTEVRGIVADEVNHASTSLAAQITATSGGLQNQLTVVSGGLQERPTSSGAETIASNTARNVLSGGGYVSGGDVENMLNASAMMLGKPFSTTLQINDSTSYQLSYTSNGGFKVRYVEIGGEEFDYQTATDYAVTLNGGVVLSAGNEIDSVDAHVSVGWGGIELSYQPDGSTAPVSVAIGGGSISVGGGSIPNVAIEDGAVTIGTEDSTVASFSNDSIALQRYVNGEAGGVSEHTIEITSGGVTLSAEVTNSEGEFSRAVTLNSRGLSMTGPDIPTVEMGSGGVLVDGNELATANAVTSATSGVTKSADTMPSASAELVGKLYVYTGETSASFKHGHLYVCRAEGASYVWKDAQTGLHSVGNLSGIRCFVIGGNATLKWSDPDDLVLDGVTLAQWGKTVLVRKSDGYPTSPDDGTVLLTSTTRNAYKSSGFIEPVPAGETYYYRWFIYTDDGVLNDDPANEAVTGVLTWASILDMCGDPSIDMRDVFSPGDVLTAANSVRATDGNGNFEWQVTDVTEHDFGIAAYKCFAQLQFDAPQKAFALTPDTVFATSKLLNFSGYNTTNGDYFLKDETATGNDRVWRRRSGTMEVRYYNGGWIVFNTTNSSTAATQTTSAADPWDGTWSNSIVVAKAKKYYTFDGTNYNEATVTDGDAVTPETYYEANPGGTNRINYGSNDYENSPLDQLLNSDGDAGMFLVLPTIWSNAPSWAAQQAGFMKGFDPEFLAAVKPTTFNVNLNTVCAGGGQKTLVRKFYLLSQTEVGLGGTEGTVLDFYNGAENADRIKYNLSGGAQHWWLRSPYTGNSYLVYGVLSSGALNYYNANGASGVVPACRIGYNPTT